MKNQRKVLSGILAIFLLLGSFPLVSPALAAGQYILPHSNIRDLTRQELWEWSYESLGFILNEIFARHGYNFNIGGRYHNYFMQRPWYAPNADSDNSRACYSQMNSLEWRNERLVKDVREEMRRMNTKNTNGKHYLDYIEDPFDVLSGFQAAGMKPNQKFSVFSAPSAASYRGANGKASVSTNGDVFAAGWDNGWLMIMYATNNGSVRVGYIDGKSIKDRLTLPMLNFSSIPVTVTKATALTDDPAMAFSQIMQLQVGTKVTYLSEFHNRYAWAYVETTFNGKAIRGFIDASALDSNPVDIQEDSIGEDYNG